MKLSSSIRTRARPHSREDSHAMVSMLAAMGLLCLTTLALLAAPVPTGKPGTYPAWWFSRNVIAQTTPTNASPNFQPVDISTAGAVISYNGASCFVRYSDATQETIPGATWITSLIRICRRRF